jgi:magnesium transporter
MAYFSDLLGKPVSDVGGKPVGRLQDLVAAPKPGTPHPMIVAAQIRRHRQDILIPISDIAVLVAPAIPLTESLESLHSYTPASGAFFLAREVLDKQIIDTNGVRVVRVNDLELARLEHAYYIANVDVGTLGLLRRLGLHQLLLRLARLLGRDLPSVIIDWQDVEFLPGDQPMRLKVSGDKLADLHPADLAEILSDLSRTEGDRFLAALDVKTVADALEEIEPDFQASLVETMPDEVVADVLEEMAPDEAADLLAELPQARSLDLLELMENEHAEDVRMLLAFPVDSAGGIMTTDFIAIRPELTAAEAIEAIRRQAPKPTRITYVYVTDAKGILTGVLSLGELVLADPKQPIAEFMHPRVVTVGLTSPQDEVAQSIAKYNLVAIPVTDEKGRIQGIVTADDALDKINPTAWKKRLPRLYH